MTGKEVTGIVFRGVERSKAPVLSEDGSALESFNLRPAQNGLELVHDKAVSASVSFPSDAGVQDKEITYVYRHRALPEGDYLFVFGNRTILISSGSSVLREEDGTVFRIEYEEDILEMGELNNVLVVRTKAVQDFWLWNEGRYSKMPAIRMPSEMTLEQEFDSSVPTKVQDRPFFGAVIGFDVPKGEDDWEEKFEQNKEQALQYVQGIRAEEESEQRKLGKFIGHVLVRCAFKTAQENYISYGPVLHAEIGAYAQATKTSRFPKNEGEEQSLEWHEKLYAKLLDDSVGDSADTIPPDGAETDDVRPLWPISCLWNIGSEKSNPVFEISHEGLLPNAGFSQPPVFVGAIPYSVYENITFRGQSSDAEGYQNPGMYKLHNGKARKNAIGVYAPGIVYSYPILKIRFDKETIEAMRYYKGNNIVQSLCVAMTAPVKHGYGTNLVKVNTIKYGFFENLSAYYWDEDENQLKAPLYGTPFKKLPDTNSSRKNDDYLYVYGYPRNIDADPERLMDSHFYIVKDISLEQLLSDENLVEGGVYEIPLQLKSIGVVEEEQEDGSVNVTTSEDAVANSQEEQIDPDYVSLENIENAKPLPTDNFSCHTFMGNSYMEYNRRLHLFGGETVLFEGYSPSPIIKRDEIGFGGNNTTTDPSYTRGLYLESLIVDNGKKILKRHPITGYLYRHDGSTKKTLMVLPDIITYPDYRCKMMRIVMNEGGKWYNQSGDLECKNSVLNNFAYVAFTTKDISEAGDIRLSCSQGLTIEGNIKEIGALGNLKGYCVQVYDCFVYASQMQGIPLGGYGYAYAPDDTLAYCNRIVDMTDPLSKPEADYTGMDIESVLDDSNRVQVSGTDDVFYYPSVNSYRIGSASNRIIAANSVYGQVTEQKFGMFPLYLFSKEGVFTMEQGTGDILYLNISKINDDCLTGKQSLCTTGDSIAYLVRDGLRIIQGRQAVRVAMQGDGDICINLPASGGTFNDAVSSFFDLVSLSRFNEEIQGASFLWDSYHHEILMFCIPASGRNRFVTWGYNTDSAQLFKRADDLNGSLLTGIIQNERNLAWHVSEWDSTACTIKIYDFNSSDQRTFDGNTDKSEFLYVSNPLKIGKGAYNRIEHSVLRFYGSGIDFMEVLYFGSLDGLKWFKMGGGRVVGRREMSDFTMRRMPCSVRYLIMIVKGKAGHIQIQRLDAETRMKYLGRLR